MKKQAAKSDAKSRMPPPTPTPTPMAMVFVEPLLTAGELFGEAVDSVAVVLEAVENTRREEVDLAVAMMDGSERVRSAFVVLLQQSFPSALSQHHLSSPQ
jgi:hypothetical protein